MSRSKRIIIVLFAASLSISFGAIYADSGYDVNAPDPGLQIDIPVKLDSANAVFYIGNVGFTADAEISLAHLEQLSADFQQQQTKGKIIAIFHSKAGFLLLNDAAYNALRRETTGNPFKQTITDLMSQGVQFEESGGTCRAFHWVNSDLLPGVKVNTDAPSRLTQLVEEGYVQLPESN
jgi:intracellular sulfur oxidation DsrE/DsrF family protein